MVSARYGTRMSRVVRILEQQERTAAKCHKYGVTLVNPDEIGQDGGCHRSGQVTVRRGILSSP
jgi:hypothetical protein